MPGPEASGTDLFGAGLASQRTVVPVPVPVPVPPERSGSRGFDACLACLAVVPLLLLLVATSTSTLAGDLGVVVCFLCLYQVIRCSREPDAGPVAIGFYAFVGIWAGLGSVVQIALGRLPWPDFARVDLYPLAQALTLLAVVCHMLGRKLERSWARRAGCATRALTRPWPWRPILVTAALAVPSIGLTGGLAARFRSRSEFTDVLAAQGISYDGGQSIQLGLLRILPSATSLVAVYLAILAWRLRRADGLPLRMSDHLAVVVALGAAAVFANPLSASRFNAFSVALAVLFAAVPLRTVRAKIAFGTLLCVGLIVVYPLASWFKRPPGAIDLPEVGTESLLTIDYDGFQQVINESSTWSAPGTGRDLHALSRFFWVPRSAWRAGAAGQLRRVRRPRLSLPATSACRCGPSSSWSSRCSGVRWA